MGEPIRVKKYISETGMVAITEYRKTAGLILRFFATSFCRLNVGEG